MPCRRSVREAAERMVFPRQRVSPPERRRRAGTIDVVTAESRCSRLMQ